MVIIHDIFRRAKIEVSAYFTDEQVGPYCIFLFQSSAVR